MQIFKHNPPAKFLLLKFVLPLTLLFVFLVSTPINLLGESAPTYPDSNGFGQIDFVEYWSAVRLLEQGKNPYLPETMLAFQKQEFGKTTPTMMWNPPWLLLQIYSVLLFDFGDASLLWAYIQLLLTAISSWLIVHALPKPRCSNGQHLTIVLMLLSFTFAPLYNSLHFGQIGGLLLFGCALLYCGLAKEKIYLVIASALPLSTKPHLFVLVGIILLWQLLSKRSWKPLFGCGVILLLQVIVTEIVFPGSVTWWLSSFAAPVSDLVPKQLDWVGPTLGGALRAYLDWTYLAFLIPPICWLLTLCYLILFRPPINWREQFPYILGFSVYLAPFGWFFDQTTLLVLFAFLLSQALHSYNYFRLTLLLLLQLSAYLYISAIAIYQHELWWFAIALILFGCNEKMIRCRNAGANFQFKECG